ncbi:MAG: sulfur carrier protein ThiS [Myxococcales bacterium]|nr:sulfur carrier protein ThiS [Myxococcales bacterium]
MRITLNGKLEDLPDSMMVGALVDRLGLGERQSGVAVAVNDCVVPRSQWPNTRLEEGDRVELVGAVSGG